ncbi:MAG: phosphoesterase [Fimbriiglobus sp.]
MKPDEAVLGIPAKHFEAWGRFTGFRFTTPEELAALLDPKHFEFRWRSQCETDPTFLQLIPYVVLTSHDWGFNYQRGASGTEKRLEALRSIGIGGHISEADAEGGSDPYSTGLAREVREEVRMADVVETHCPGVIYDPRTPVGEVHLGIVHIWKLAEPYVDPREAAIAKPAWLPWEVLRGRQAEYETWSQLVLETISGLRRL